MKSGLVTVITQINKSMVYFTVRCSANLGVPNANPCTNCDVKSGFRVGKHRTLPLYDMVGTYMHLAFTFHCTTVHRYLILSTRYSVMCKVYTGYCGTSEIEHG